MAALLCASASIFAQSSQTETNDAQLGASGLHMIARTTKAVDYRKGATTGVDIGGTDLMPEVSGKAKVISKKGLVDIHVDVDHLRPASALDPAYLTYVLWAVSPEGKPKNIGELIERAGRATLHTTTDLQAFALVVSAEPDYAVNQPSEFVVGENLIRPTTKGVPETIDVHYQVFPRSTYVPRVLPAAEYSSEDRNVPLDLLEARNALRIARDARAEEYAPDMLKHAESLLTQAEDYYRRKQGEKSIATVAREATQTAEEARESAGRAEEQARLERERNENQQRTAEAQTAAEQARQQAQQAEDQAQIERRQAAAAERQRQDAEQQAALSREQAQQAAERNRHLEEQQQAAAQQAAQAQQQAQQAQQQAATEAQQRAMAEEQGQQQAAQAEQARQQAAQAQQRAENAETEQRQEREQLMSRLNQVLGTKDSARGLIVSMPDVLFDTNSANLKTGARESLAKVAGILLSYPDIHVEVDGYTDNTGNPLLNQQLSEQRAAAVQAYLTQQGVPSSSVATHGFGQANPIASNDTAAGRQQNRRVELVVSGRSIGTSPPVP
ncbi:MAG: DUF4398 and OmpA-like domain-containing protein [Acidobacteria bacterium]|nr:DUF4398 and OmpA-like domain-containing protein [Acidobacteriota bacterium]